MAEQTFTSGQILTAAQMTTLQSNTGLAWISTTTIGSAVSSVTVSGAFSSTYDNYKIIVSGGVSSASCSLGLTLGASATGYYAGLVFITYSTNSVGGLGTNNGSSFVYSGLGTTSSLSANIELLNPFNAKTTSMSSAYLENSTAGSSGMYNGYHNSAVSYSAFTLTPSTGTLTGGSISVYGYRK